MSDKCKPGEILVGNKCVTASNHIRITSRGITMTGHDTEEVSKQQDKCIDQTSELIGDEKIIPMPYTDRPKRGELRTRIAFKGVSKSDVSALKKKLRWYGI